MRNLSSLLAMGLISAGLAASPAPAGGLEEMTDAERTAFRAEVRQYLIENPDVLMEAMAVLEERQAQAETDRDLTLVQTNATALFTDPTSWVGGNPDGDLTIVEFVDYRCGYCRKSFSEVSELISSDGNIRFILKEYPILGEQSLLSSQFAIAVRQLHGDDAYKAAHDVLINLRGDATPETLARVATDLGHDPQAILDKMASAEVSAVIAANQTLGQTMEVNGTPTFVINQTMVRGYVPLDGMRQIVADARG